MLESQIGNTTSGSARACRRLAAATHVGEVSDQAVNQQPRNAEVKNLVIAFTKKEVHESTADDKKHNT